MGKTTRNWDRKFLGKINNFSSKEEEKFEKKHLKAYLRGNTHFIHGTETVMNPITGLNQLMPKYNEVLQELIQI